MIELPLTILLWMLVILFVPVTVATVLGLIWVLIKK